MMSSADTHEKNGTWHACVEEKKKAAVNGKYLPAVQGT